MNFANLSTTAWVIIVVTLVMVIDAIMDNNVPPDQRVSFVDKMFTEKGKDYWSPMVLAGAITLTLWVTR